MQIPRDHRQEFANHLPARGNVEDGRISRLGDRLTEALRPAIAPAVALTDAVHISPEARAVASTALRSPGFPSPGDVEAALAAVANAVVPPEQAVRHLAALVRQLASVSPAVPSAASANPAAELIRVLLGHADLSAQTSLAKVAQLVRALLAEAGAAGPVLVSTAVSQRALAEILVAVVRWRAESGSVAQQPASSHETPDLPPALYSFLGGTPERRQRRQPKPQPPARKRPTKDEDPAPEHSSPEFSAPEFSAPEFSAYRSSPRRT